MTNDISVVLAGWPYDDEAGLQVRWITADDGTRRIQLRVDLGLLQMEVVDRPDGERPHGFSSLLEYYRQEAEAYRGRHGWYEGFELCPADCGALRQEALQYYHRRIARMALQDYAGAVADAEHNLEILNLLKAFAKNREDWLLSEQYRAFIVSHRVQSLALQHLSQDQAKAALIEVERGLRQVREIFAEHDRLEELDESPELSALEELRRKIEGRYCISRRERLQLLLDDALRREDPEAAAELRAQLRELEPEDD
ncbi:MAG TPA: hypothetical protein VFU47_10115 [Armatimonadota bacterium]|nr:hypothetical protein [Armatimonadota bacterium]